MKQAVFILFFFMPFFGFAQFGISFHQSNLPFAGFNYEFKNRIRPEVRIGVDNYSEDLSLEGIVTYDFVEKEDYEFYAGLGVRTNGAFTGVVIPVGINIYPLPVKQFGFHIEFAPLIADGTSVLRGSWGIRYRFKSNDQRRNK